MRKTKLWKRILGLTLSLTMMAPTVPVYAKEGELAKGEMFSEPGTANEQEENALAFDAKADENGFVIDENGVLTKYTGTAAEIVIPDDVTSIGDGAFMNCSGLTNVTFPVDLKSIGEYAFYGCGLTNVTLPNGLTDVGFAAFSNCANLEDVIIPNSMTRIENYLFADCKRLSNITLPEGLTTIGGLSFENCVSLEELTIPESVTTIEGYAFICSGLKNITLPEGLTTIENWAFASCTNLSSIILPDQMKTIEEAVFSDCINLKSIIFPKELITIKGLAFSNCSSLTRVTLPSSVTKIYGGAFSGCSSLTNIEIAEGNDKYKSFEGAVYEFSENEIVLSIWPAGKYDINLLENVTRIGAFAFSGCMGLSNVKIPESVTQIEDGAFYGCSNLVNIELPNSLVSIGQSVFGKCNRLIDIEVAEENNQYKSYEGCLYTYSENKVAILTCPVGKNDVKLLNGVTHIGDGAFRNCSNLAKIELPEGIIKIENNAFFDCVNLTSINLPDGITNIGESAFYGCINLTSINLPDSITDIGEFAFYGCINLTSIIIPDSIRDIGSYAFDKCNQLTIYGKNGSYAQKYAEQNNIPFESMKETVPQNLSDCEIMVNAESYVYDGTPKKPIVVIKKGSTNLIENTDYTIAYQNNVNAGIATVILTGKGNYTGTVNRTYQIATQSINGAQIALSAYNYTYDGTAKKPTVTVILNNRKLTEKTEYTIAYSNHVKAGTATVTITGVGNYTGTSTATFVIQAEEKDSGDKDNTSNKDDMTNKDNTSNKDNTAMKKTITKASVTLKKKSYIYDGKIKKPTVTVKIGRITLKANRDYTVSYKKNKNIGTAIVTIIGKGSYKGKVTKTFKIAARKGTTFTISGAKYKITNSAQVSFTGIKNTKASKVTIPATVKIGGKTFKVTSVANNALKNKSRITSVTIGTNVTSIGTNAFFGCKKLGTITLKSAKLKKTGKNAFRGIKATAKIKVPKSKLKTYQKLLKGKGQGGRVRVVKS